MSIKIAFLYQLKISLWGFGENGTFLQYWGNIQNNVAVMEEFGIFPKTKIELPHDQQYTLKCILQNIEYRYSRLGVEFNGKYLLYIYQTLIWDPSTAKNNAQAKNLCIMFIK